MSGSPAAAQAASSRTPSRLQLVGHPAAGVAAEQGGGRHPPAQTWAARATFRPLPPATAPTPRPVDAPRHQPVDREQPVDGGVGGHAEDHPAPPRLVQRRLRRGAAKRPGRQRAAGAAERAAPARRAPRRARRRGSRRRSCRRHRSRRPRRPPAGRRRRPPPCGRAPSGPRLTTTSPSARAGRCAAASCSFTNSMSIEGAGHACRRPSRRPDRPADPGTPSRPRPAPSAPARPGPAAGPRAESTTRRAGAGRDAGERRGRRPRPGSAAIAPGAVRIARSSPRVRATVSPVGTSARITQPPRIDPALGHGVEHEPAEQVIPDGGDQRGRAGRAGPRRRHDRRRAADRHHRMSSTTFSHCPNSGTTSPPLRIRSGLQSPTTRRSITVSRRYRAAGPAVGAPRRPGTPGARRAGMATASFQTERPAMNPEAPAAGRSAAGRRRCRGRRLPTAAPTAPTGRRSPARQAASSPGNSSFRYRAPAVLGQQRSVADQLGPSGREPPVALVIEPVDQHLDHQQQVVRGTVGRGGPQQRRVVAVRVLAVGAQAQQQLGPGTADTADSFGAQLRAAARLAAGPRRATTNRSARATPAGRCARAARARRAHGEARSPGRAASPADVGPGSAPGRA